MFMQQPQQQKPSRPGILGGPVMDEQRNNGGIVQTIQNTFTPKAPRIADTVRDMGKATGNKFIAGAANVAANIGQDLANMTPVMDGPRNNAPSRGSTLGAPGMLGQFGNMTKTANAKLNARACYNIRKTASF